MTSERVPDVTVTMTTTMTPPPQPAQRARRPTTLAYCERSVALPRVRRTKPPDVSRAQPPPTEPPKAAVVTVAAEVVAVRPPPPRTRVVAPTATPEDSYVEDGSSSCGVALAELPVAQTSAADTSTTLSTAADILTACSDAQRPYDDDRRTLDTSCLDTQSIPEVARLSATDSATPRLVPHCFYTQSIPEVARLSTTDSVTSLSVLQCRGTQSIPEVARLSTTDSATPRPVPQRRVAMRRFHRVIAGARQRLLRQLGHRAVADEKPTATTAFSEDRASSSVTAVEEAASASTSSSRSLLAGSAPMAAVEVDVCSSASSSTAALSDNAGSDTDTLAADVSLVIGGHRISPGSPSYDEKHSRFSHVGAHALDVFYSPDDYEDDYETSYRSDSGRAAASNSSLWRPLASCSGTIQEQPLTSLHVPTRSVEFADHATSGLALPSVPEAVWRPCVGDDRSLSVQGPSDDVIMPTLSRLEVLSPTDASRSSTLVSSDNCSASAGAEEDCSTIDVSQQKFVLTISINASTDIRQQNLVYAIELGLCQSSDKIAPICRVAQQICLYIS